MSLPQPGSMRNILFAASAVSTSDVWAVGDQQGSDGTFGTLVEHWDGHTWSVVPTPALSAGDDSMENHGSHRPPVVNVSTPAVTWPSFVTAV